MNNNLLYTIYINFFNIQQKFDNNSVSNIYKFKHLIGIYDNSLNIWYNAWGLNNLDTNEIKLSKNLLKYLIDDDNIKKNINDHIVKSFMFNTKIYITEEKTQLHFILAIFLYYTKIYNYEFKKIDNLIYYYALNNEKII
jgi:hypothetical protein